MSLAPLIGWNLANALAWAGDGRLSNEKQKPPNEAGKSNNYQQDALRDFLSLYWVTKEDLTAQIQSGHAAQKLLVQNALFRSGDDSLITKVLIGGKTTASQNDYKNIRAVLGNLGIANSTSKDHQNHFHLYLKPPELQPIITPPLRLEAEVANFEGDDAMWIAADMAQALPLDNPPAVEVAQAATQKPLGKKLRLGPRGDLVTLNDEEGFAKVLTYCQDVSSFADLYPDANVVAYLGFKEDPVTRQWTPPFNWSRDSKFQVLKPPMHGIVGKGVFSGEPNLFGYWATSRDDQNEATYTGKDRVVFLVEVKGQKFKVVVNLWVQNGAGDRGNVCETKKFIAITPPTLAAWLANINLHNLSGEILFDDLPDAALGTTTTTGSSAKITLDTTAAGHGWFIDTTPSDNTEFLPTSNPNEWVAKEGSEAAGKMDLLTVLLHEYGHALGLEHSTDAHDFMATTLQPGVRRTLTVDEQLALMQLTGFFPTPDSPSTPYGPTDPGVPLPFTRVLSNARNARLRREEGLDALVPQFDTAANAKLTNPEFAGAQGWATTGDVAFTHGAATLTETASTQTRLNQVFVLGENDRFLSFTLANTALGDQANGPDDAFEVALIDASTGHSLMSGTGLNRNDAIVNRQADGSEYKATGITVVANADGSRTYLVDLAGIPAGTVVNLAFDLIGFGSGIAATNSHLTIRNLHLGGLQTTPQTTDDAATLAEDTSATIDTLANDSNAQQPGFVPVVVANEIAP